MTRGISVRAGAMTLVAALATACSDATPEDPTAVTWTRDVAPILFDHCVRCHRPGEAAPFSLLTYRQAQKRARQIVEVTTSHFMPPWLPTGDSPSFRGDRSLSDAQIDTLTRWRDLDCPEGSAADLPPEPEFTDGWQLGEPDLVVKLDQPFELPADGRDVFRNFVLPVPVDKPRYVRATEIRPGSKRIVHHGLLRVDSIGDCTAADAQDAAPGFPGMDMLTAQAPGGGHMLGWLPGRTPEPGPEGTAWLVEPGDALVLQLHMLPSGKPEQVQPAIGLRFTSTPPTRNPLVLRLDSNDLSIPAGQPNFEARDEFVLPAPVELTAIQPHAHYVCREMRVDATFPSGMSMNLLTILDWDFNWQDAYTYEEPLRLPAGTRIEMRYVYDNSAENPRNPFSPPRAIQFGQRSTDEMCELFLQVFPRDRRGADELKAGLFQHMIDKAPGQPVPLARLADTLIELDRTDEAADLYLAALEIDPRLPGVRNNLASLLLERGDVDTAIRYYREEIQMHPTLAAPHVNLARAYERREQRSAAIDEYKEALRLDPDNVRVMVRLARWLHADGSTAEAIQWLRRALKLDPGSEAARRALRVIAGRGDL